MAGRRLFSDGDIRELLADAQAMLEELDPPEHLWPRVYSSCVEVLTLPDSAMTRAEGL